MLVHRFICTYCRWICHHLRFSILMLLYRCLQSMDLCINVQHWVICLAERTILLAKAYTDKGLNIQRHTGILSHMFNAKPMKYLWALFRSNHSSNNYSTGCNWFFNHCDYSIQKIQFQGANQCIGNVTLKNAELHIFVCLSIVSTVPFQYWPLASFCICSITILHIL